MDLKKINQNIEELSATLTEHKQDELLTWMGSPVANMEETHIINCLVKQRVQQSVYSDLEENGIKLDTKFDGRDYSEWLTVFTIELRRRKIVEVVEARLDKFKKLKGLADKEEQRSLLIEELEQELKAGKKAKGKRS